MKTTECCDMKRIIACCACIVFAMILLITERPRCASAQQHEAAPEFSLNDLQGVNHSLSYYRGKVVVINFWASWCPECVEEMPSLNTLYEKFKGRGLVVLGIAIDQNRDAIDPLLKQTHVTYPILLNRTGSTLLRQYKVIGLPSTIVIDSNGIISARVVGRTDFGSSAFTKKIEDLTDSAFKEMRGL